MLTRAKISIVIPTYNREYDLIRAINSVFKQDFDKFELIIVDQTTKHELKTEKFIKSIADKRFRYFKVNPPSLPAARNFAIKKSTADIIVFIDDDVDLEPGFLAEHLKAYKDKDVGGVAGRVYSRTEPSSDLLYRLTSSGKRIGGFNFEFDDDHAMAARGCNMSFRKKILIEIGGFDTGYTENAYREDTDVSFRVRNAGYKLVYRSNASLLHFDAPTGGCREGGGLFNSAVTFKNNFRFFYKNEPPDSLISFYKTHWLHIVPSLNPIMTIKRTYYLLTAPRQAKQDLKRQVEIVAKEFS